MSRTAKSRRRFRFEVLEERKVMDAAGLIAVDGSTVDHDAAIVDSPTSVASSAAQSTVAEQQVGGVLTLDSVILGGVQNDLVISLSGSPLVNTELSGTIEIGNATGDGVGITGFSVDGGLVTASDTSGLLSLTGVSANPLDINPGINPVTGGNFDASEVGLSINNGIASIAALGLSFDFGTDPVEGPGSGTGTIVVNSINGLDYNITVTIPVALELEAAPGAIADVEGTIVASGVVTVARDPAEIMSGFYNDIKESIGSDDVFGDLIVDAKSAIDSGDVAQRAEVYVEIQTRTAELSLAVVDAFFEIEAGVSDAEELNFLHYTVTVVIAELEALRDFLSGALQSPAPFAPLSEAEFFGAAVQAVQDQVFGSGDLD